MSKEKLYSILTEEQRDFVEFLIDSAYSNGLSEGRAEASAVQYYNNW